jgi:hypothetical protein
MIIIILLLLIIIILNPKFRQSSSLPITPTPSAPIMTIQIIYIIYIIRIIRIIQIIRIVLNSESDTPDSGHEKQATAFLHGQSVVVAAASLAVSVVETTPKSLDHWNNSVLGNIPKYI